MEPQQQQNQQPNEDSSGTSGKGGFLCRQSSTRWTPTTDQIRILKDLYYNNGVRSPSAEQIQRISARLRQYGKIEGKNVFYWFQNHKARERQKKRFTSTDHVSMQRSAAAVANGSFKPEDSNHNNKYPNLTTPGFSSASPSSGSVIAVGQMGNYGYGSVTMEKSFRDCSISASGGSSRVGGGSISHNFGWVGFDPYSSSYTLFDNRRNSIDETFDEEEEEEEEDEDELEGEGNIVPEIETLPLFPMHGEDINSFCNNIKPNNSDPYYYSAFYDGTKAASRASLELSLNSYSGRAPGSI